MMYGIMFCPMRIYFRMKNMSLYMYKVQLHTGKKYTIFHNGIKLPNFLVKRDIRLTSACYYSLICRNIFKEAQKSLTLSTQNLDLLNEPFSKLHKRKFSDTYEKESTLLPQSNIGHLLELCENQLQKEGILEPRLDAEYIISQALNISRIDLNLHKNEIISSEALDQINDMMRCRLARMPIQYIFGDWEFHSLKLKLCPPVFIPRPETEELVNLSVRALSETGSVKPLALDVGCGSGAISLALLNMIPELTCVAVDQSKYAVNLTLENARDLRLENRVHVISGKVTEEKFPDLPFNKFDLIVSNPPYVLKKDISDLQPEITLYEDMRALYGGVDGMEIIKNIILHGQYLLNDQGRMILEVDPQHFYSLPIWLEENKTTMEICQFYKDFNGMQRYIELKKKTQS